MCFAVEARRRAADRGDRRRGLRGALQSDTIRGYEEHPLHFPDFSPSAARARDRGLREAYFWRRSVNTNTAHAYWTYLRRYPKGPLSLMRAGVLR